MAGALSVAILFALVRRFAGPRVAAVVALLAATAPYLVWYGQEAKMYALLTVIIPLSLWLTLEVSRRGSWWKWCLLYGVTSLSFYTHVLAALVVPLQVIWLLVLAERGQMRRRTLCTAGYLLALVLPYLPMIWWQAKLWLSPTFETGHPFVTLPQMLRVLTVAFTRGVLPVTAAATLLPTILALLAGFVLWPGRRRALLLLATWLLWPPLALYGVSLGMPIFADRYLIWIMPAFLALVAAGVVGLGRIWRPLGAITLAAIVGLNLSSVWLQTSQPVKSDFRSAAEFVLMHARQGDAIMYQIPYGRHTLEYYAGTRFRSVDGPFTNNGMSPEGLAATMLERLAGVGAVWLVASESAEWDRRDLTRWWLATRGYVTDTADFARVSVTRYQLLVGYEYSCG
jgi:uncharacterized membrane protein